MHTPERNSRTALKLLTAAVGMFAFAVFLLPPLYDFACEVLGINGKNVSTAEAATGPIDWSREVTVEFVANTFEPAVLDFRAPSPSKIRVHPGRLKEVSYTARNRTDEVLWVQAIHSIVPGQHGKHVNVIECFCFTAQKFEPGEERKLTFGFTISPKLPPEQGVLSVSYTFFKLNNPPEASQ